MLASTRSNSDRLGPTPLGPPYTVVVRVLLPLTAGLLLAATTLTPVAAQDWELSGSRRTASRPAPASRPTVDPALVGKWRGRGRWAGLFSFHSLGEWEYEIGSSGILKQQQVARREGPTIFLLHAADGRWTLDSPDGSRRSGGYGISADGELACSEGERSFIRLNRVENDEVATTSRRSETEFRLNSTDIPTLVLLASEPVPERRELALFHLASLAYKNREDGIAAVPALIVALDDVSPGVASMAAGALGAIGPRGKAAAPALIKALRNGKADLREHSAKALGQIVAEPDLTIPALSAMLMDEDEQSRVAAVEALGRVGTRVAGVLGTALADRSSRVNRAAMDALKKLGPEAGPALPGLILALREGAGTLSREAAEVIGIIGPSARAAVPSLVQAVEAGSPDVAVAATDALRSFPGDAATSVPAIAKLLDHWRASMWSWRKRLIESLGAFGPSAAAAVPTLTTLIEDASEPTYLRRAAEAARDRIVGTGLSTRAQDLGHSSRVADVLRSTIRDKKAAILVAVVESSAPPTHGRLGFEYVISVEEIIKPLRDDAGTYYVPLAIERAHTSPAPELHVGNRYLMCVRCGIGNVSLIDALDVPDDTGQRDSLLGGLRTAAETEGTTGSSLELFMLIDTKVDWRGLTTSRRDGSVDLHAFGVSKERIAHARRSGERIAALQFREAPLAYAGPREWTCNIDERLLGEWPVSTFVIVTDVEFLSTSSRPVFKPTQPPFKPSKVSAHFSYLVIVDSDPVRPKVVARVPLLGPKDSCLQTVRRWVADTSDTESKPVESRSVGK
jgi:HEAT repeat protein